MFKIELSRNAVRSLESLNAKLQERIYKAIENIKDNPFGHPNVRKLHGIFEGNYRYRIGAIRIIYSVNAKRKVVSIIEIGQRKDVYKH